MRNLKLTLLVLSSSCFAALGACDGYYYTDPDPDPPVYVPSPPPPPPGPSCSVGYLCSGDDLTYCDGASVEVWDCDDLCVSEGYDYATGCGYDGGAGGDTCFCDIVANDPGPVYDPGPACYPEDVFCNGDLTIETCGADGYPVAWNCDLVCQDQGFDYSAGCGFDPGAQSDACFCE